MAGNVAALREHGVDPSTPVAVVERATWDESSTTLGTLDTIVERCDARGVRPPAVFVVGDVVDVRQSIERVLDAAAGTSRQVDRHGRADAELTDAEGTGAGGVSVGDTDP
jgi:precorrin-4 methylase